MRNIKRSLSILLVIAIALTFLAACSKESTPPVSSPDSTVSATTSASPDASSNSQPSGSQGTPASESNLETKTVRIGIAGDPASLDPWSLIGEGRMDVLRNVYEFLFDIPYIGGGITPVIASGYEQLDAQTFNIKIYDYVSDSKGNHITADDVVFSYESAGFTGADRGAIESVTAIDSMTIQFKLNTTADGAFENAVGYTAIVSKSEYEANPDAYISNPIGTGPYVVTEHVPGSSLSFTKSANYWQTNKDLVTKFSQSNIGNIRYVVIPESSQLTMALESGAIDIGYFVATSDIHRFNNGNYSVFMPPKDLADLILFNCQEGNIFTNQALRQAVCYAIDSNILLQNAYEGNGRVCKTYGSSVFSDYLDKWENEDYLDFNPSKAKELLIEAGYPNGVTVTLLVANRPQHIRMGQIIQSMLGDIGISVEITQVDTTAFASYARNIESQIPFDFYLDNRSSFDYIVNVWAFSFDANRNRGMTVNFYVDGKLQDLLATAIDQSTHNEQNTDALHKYLKEICIGYGICYGTYNFVTTNTITDLARDFKSRLVPGGCTYTSDFIGG